MDKEKFESLKALNMAHDSALQMLILAPSDERVAFYREACAYLAALSIVIGVSKETMLQTVETLYSDALEYAAHRSSALTDHRHK